MSDSLQSYLWISTALLAMSVFGLLSRRNLVAMLISLELILNSASLNFVAFSRFTMPDRVTGQIFAIFIIALAAAEVCIGLSFVLLLHRMKKSIRVEDASELKG